MPEGGHDFFVYRLVGLSEELAALGMSDDHVFAPDRDEHLPGDLAGIGPALFPEDVLGA
jgi:hypothetical protein